MRVVCLEDTDFHNLHPALADSDIDSKDGFALFVSVGLYHGGILLAPEMTSKQVILGREGDNFLIVSAHTSYR
jgi:hypothetical protein